MPSVIFAVQDGNLGILPSQDLEPTVIIGATSGGAALLNKPFVATRHSDLAVVGNGDSVALASMYVAAGLAVLFCKSGNTTAGVPGTVDSTGKTGTSVVTVSGNSYLSAEIAIRFPVGGTIGTAGIQYQTSLDGGRSWKAVKSLGTANTITVDGSGLVFNFAAGTIVANDIVRATPKAPEPNDAEVLAALNACGAHEQSWDLFAVAATATSSMFDVVSTAANTLTLKGRPVSGFMFMRNPNTGESEATYRTAMNTAMVGKAGTYLEVCAGACRMSSGLDSSRLLVPGGWAISLLTAGLEPHLPASMPAHGGLPVSIRENGIAFAHDERDDPGLGSQTDRFSTLTTYYNLKGVHANRAQLFSPSGSDFDLHVHRRVLNKALRTAYVPMVLRLQAPVPVNSETGYIREDVAKEWEGATQDQLESIMLARPWASFVEFKLSRTDNLLSTKEVNGEIAITPLGYPDVIRIGVSFRNPALRVAL